MAMLRRRSAEIANLINFASDLLIATVGGVSLGSFYGRLYGNKNLAMAMLRRRSEDIANLIKFAPHVLIAKVGSQGLAIGTQHSRHTSMLLNAIDLNIELSSSTTANLNFHIKVVAC
jgi:hypothetical protein